MRKAIIRPVVAVIKSMASAISIGSGGSVGREGPIIQIGSSFGSTLGQILRLPTWERMTLIACGAGGGIAATFNTPVGGILFAVDIMMHEVSARTLVPGDYIDRNRYLHRANGFRTVPIFYHSAFRSLISKSRIRWCLLAYVELDTGRVVVGAVHSNHLLV